MVSIIVPVYNGKNYIKRCVASLQSQTYKGDYEVILVNDGSIDGSDEICDSYICDRIRVIHQENQGLSAARNTGTKVAYGNYVTFVDVDDYVTETYLETLVNLLSKYDADISVVKHKVVYHDKVDIMKIENTIEEKCVSAREALHLMFYGQGISTASWAKLYKKEIILNNLFPVGRIYEDYATTYKYIGESSKIAYTTREEYMYYQHEGSILHSKIDSRKIDSLLKSKHEIDIYIEKKYPGMQKAANFRFIVESMALYRNILDYSDESKKIYNILKGQWKPIIKDSLIDSNAETNTKIRMIVIYMGYDIMWLYWKINNILKSKRSA